MSRRAEVERKTKETQIRVIVDMDQATEPDVETSLPFFDHMLTAMAFHGGFGLTVRAAGDVDVDPHHVVEDTGIVLGQCLETVLREGGPVARFGHAVVPMDEALSEATIDVCGRPTLVYRAELPQHYAGDFALWLLREFFSGLSMGARIALHLDCRYGENAHHMVEALCKAAGRAIGHAYRSAAAGMSTKGVI
ncbi:MAG: imidazoleglycerol-phosphate dehydratase [Spirochaetota bacterium]